LFRDDYSLVVLDDNEEILQVFLNSREQWHFPPSETHVIPEKLLVSVKIYEDEFFNYHPGFNPFSILRAIKQNRKEGRIVSGGSTITMQLARLLKKKERTYPNKFIEILQAIKLEMRYKKKNIIYSYLSHAPYGGNIVGFEAACLRYFKKAPDKLTWSEACTLAILPNAPGLISPFQNPDKLWDKKNFLLEKLYIKNIIDEQTMNLSKIEKTHIAVFPTSPTAPHFCRDLFINKKLRGRIHTFINKGIQSSGNEIIASHARYLNNLGIKNVSSVIIETRTGNIRAYFGSHDFFNTDINGQVDGVTAPRSSASILKPYLYTLAIDKGLALPEELLRDIPVSYNGFTPRNADKNFNALVPFKESLIRSLNVPSVNLLEIYGVKNFYYDLQNAGVSSLHRTPEEYGLPLILGGAEITLLEAADIFRTIGNLGLRTPINYYKNDAATIYEKRVCSRGSSYLILEILKELNRPGSEFFWESFQNKWPIAWKTGTSYGNRDAWAIGVNPEWTIAVWSGNFDGSANANINGAGCSGPILFDLFNALPKQTDLAWFSFPNSDLKSVKICSYSGMLASESCPEVKESFIPIQYQANKVCIYHHSLHIDKKNKTIVCSRCWHGREYEKKKVLILPADVVQVYLDNGIIIEDQPVHNKECQYGGNSKQLKIIYPLDKSKIWLPRGFDNTQQKIVLKAAHSKPNTMIYWHLDNYLIKETSRHHQFAVDLNRGTHTLSVIDKYGNKDTIIFDIEHTAPQME